ncbi:WhiB family transcriptional regulator [Streptomyces sp. NPDC006283]|uniref:WhiB family transcriptional regulator n=1 Tax=Streptomyces sp. NPDC006283 TaxID=3156741 RepID=UPI0033AFE6BE
MTESSDSRWQREAACAAPDVDPDVFFPSHGNGRPGWDRLAKGICRTCTVIDPCFRMALREGITDGIWGGLGGWERHSRGGPRPTRGRRPRTLGNSRPTFSTGPATQQRAAAASPEVQGRAVAFSQGETR